MINARTICLTLFLVLFLVLGAQAVHIGGLTGHYPQTLIVLAILFTVWVIIDEVHTTDDAERAYTVLANLWRGTPSQRWRFGVFVLAWIAYPLLLTLAGFLVATTVVLAISLLTANARRPVVTVLFSALVSLIMAVFLTSFLYIPVPLGPVDQLLDRVLYALGRS